MGGNPAFVNSTYKNQHKASSINSVALKKRLVLLAKKISKKNHNKT